MMTYNEIRRLADNDCKSCNGYGVRNKDGKMIATDDLHDLIIVPGEQRKITYMVCPCVRKNLRYERNLEKEKRN
jgi:hypothetical protein